LACGLLNEQRQEDGTMIKLTWLPNWKAYAVRRHGRMIGMVCFKFPMPFRQVIEFA
jgi:hypothetical protein